MNKVQFNNIPATTADTGMMFTHNPIMIRTGTPSAVKPEPTPDKAAGFFCFFQ